MSLRRRTSDALKSKMPATVPACDPPVGRYSPVFGSTIADCDCERAAPAKPALSQPSTAQHRHCVRPRRPIWPANRLELVRTEYPLVRPVVLDVKLSADCSSSPAQRKPVIQSIVVSRRCRSME